MRGATKRQDGSIDRRCIGNMIIQKLDSLDTSDPKNMAMWIQLMDQLLQARNYSRTYQTTRKKPPTFGQHMQRISRKSAKSGIDFRKIREQEDAERQAAIEAAQQSEPEQSK